MTRWSDSPISSCSRRSIVLAAAEPEQMVPVLLAGLEVAFAGYVADQSVGVEAHRANEVDWLAVRLIFSQPENHIMLTSLEKLVTGFLPLVVILPFPLAAKGFEGFAKLNIHHVRSRQFGRECIEKRLSFAVVRLLVGSEQLLDGFDCGNSLPGGTQCRRSKAKHTFNRTEVHLITSPINEEQAYIRARPTTSMTGGASKTFPSSMGTGGGRHETDLEGKSA
ncbi:hypothetical protein KYK29_05255 [Shinella daejeonensis]|uniref:hypothetical protein n=1 Tax=Shinella daejeonensis TaxID=659017 RepID=UPI0020C7F110|nr:hypothetical protein [Shinella daejeonensis]MCP8894329.1 hypothetical protein [Shinella daejeonensis]